MAHYIDGFVLPIPRDRLNEYKRLVQAVAEIWKEYGALDYFEYVGDDTNPEEVPEEVPPVSPSFAENGERRSADRQVREANWVSPP